MMVNLYKLYFQQNKKFFHSSTFSPPIKHIMRETKIFFILLLFYHFYIFYPPNQMTLRDKEAEVVERKKETVFSGEKDGDNVIEERERVDILNNFFFPFTY